MVACPGVRGPPGRGTSRGGKLPSPPCGGPVGGAPHRSRGVPWRQQGSRREPGSGAGRRPGPRCPTDSCSAWRRRDSRSRAGSTARASRPTTGWPGSRSAGSTPSGDAVDFWRRPEEALDRAAALGCDSFRLGVEWARVAPDGDRGRPGGARPLRGHHRGLRRAGSDPARDAAPLHPPAVAGRGPLAATRRHGPLRGLGAGGGAGPGPDRAPLGDPQRDQRPGADDLPARRVPPGPARWASATRRWRSTACSPRTCGPTTSSTPSVPTPWSRPTTSA